jgi:hypothetical protein
VPNDELREPRRPYDPHGPAADIPPERLTHHERERIKAAATHALKVFPGPIGAFLSRELLAWEQVGLRLGNGSLTHRTIDAILATPVPDPPCPAKPGSSWWKAAA